MISNQKPSYNWRAHDDKTPGMSRPSSAPRLQALLQRDNRATTEEAGRNAPFVRKNTPPMNRAKSASNVFGKKNKKPEGNIINAPFVRKSTPPMNRAKSASNVFGRKNKKSEGNSNEPALYLLKKPSSASRLQALLEKDGAKTNNGEKPSYNWKKHDDADPEPQTSSSAPRLQALLARDNKQDSGISSEGNKNSTWAPPPKGTSETAKLRSFCTTTQAILSKLNGGQSSPSFVSLADVRSAKSLNSQRSSSVSLADIRSASVPMAAAAKVEYEESSEAAKLRSFCTTTQAVLSNLSGQSSPSAISLADVRSASVPMAAAAKVESSNPSKDLGNNNDDDESTASTMDTSGDNSKTEDDSGGEQDKEEEGSKEKDRDSEEGKEKEATPSLRPSGGLGDSSQEEEEETALSDSNKSQEEEDSPEKKPVRQGRAKKKTIQRTRSRSLTEMDELRLRQRVEKYCDSDPQEGKEEPEEASLGIQKQHKSLLMAHKQMKDHLKAKLERVRQGHKRELEDTREYVRVAKELARLELQEEMELEGEGTHEGKQEILPSQVKLATQLKQAVVQEKKEKKRLEAEKALQKQANRKLEGATAAIEFKLKHLEQKIKLDKMQIKPWKQMKKQIKNLGMKVEADIDAVNKKGEACRAECRANSLCILRIKDLIKERVDSGYVEKGQADCLLYIETREMTLKSAVRGMVGSQWLVQTTTLASSMKGTDFIPIPISNDESGKPFNRRSLLAKTELTPSQRFKIDKEEWQGIKKDIKRRRSQRNLFKRSGSSPHLKVDDSDDEEPSSKPGEGLLKKRSGSLPNMAALIKKGKGTEKGSSKKGGRAELKRRSSCKRLLAHGQTESGKNFEW